MLLSKPKRKQNQTKQNTNINVNIWRKDWRARWALRSLAFTVELPQLYSGKNRVTWIHQGKPQPTWCCPYHGVACVARPSHSQLTAALYWLSHPTQTTSGLWKTWRWPRRATKASGKKKWKKGYKERWKPNGTEKTIPQKTWWRGSDVYDTLEYTPLCACKGFFKT